MQAALEQIIKMKTILSEQTYLGPPFALAIHHILKPAIQKPDDTNILQMRTTGKKGTPVFPRLLPRVDQKSPLFQEREKKPKQENFRVQDIKCIFFAFGKNSHTGFRQITESKLVYKLENPITRCKFLCETEPI
jgi:hypothetical protein